MADGGLTFVTHTRERVKKAQAAEARIIILTRTYGLPPRLIRKIQTTTTQAIVFLVLRYGGLAKRRVKKKFRNYLIDKQGRVITGMYRSTPIAPLMSESGLIPARIMLDYRKHKHAYRLLALPDGHPAKISFRLP